jgi:murein DD-endopeptidase MepM/ murein hydrolase activator NlpD
MTGDRWTFLVVRGENTPVRQYSLSARGLRALLGVAVVFVLVLTGFGLSAALDGTARINARRLATQNQALTAQIQQFHNRVDRLEKTLDGLTEKDAHVRSLAGLETIDPEVLEAGIGGPGLGSVESYPLWPVDSAAAKDAYAVSYDLNALERRADILTTSLAEATDSLVAHRDLLESTPSILPTNGWLSSAFSDSRMHPIHNRPLPHEGIDIAAPKGTPIFAAAKGRVVRAGWITGYGLTVEIDHGYGYVTLYGHASKLLVKRGQLVNRGDVIAQVGSTGLATGCNLHYEVRVNGVPVNPLNFIMPASVP